MGRKTTRAAEHSLPPLESCMLDRPSNMRRGGTLLPRVRPPPGPSYSRVYGKARKVKRVIGVWCVLVVTVMVMLHGREVCKQED